MSNEKSAQQVVESNLEHLRFRMADDRREIVAQLRQLAERASRYASEMDAAPDLNPSEFAKLTPELARLIDAYSVSGSSVRMLSNVAKYFAPKEG